MGGNAVLMVLFWIGGQPYFLDGFRPTDQPSIEICEERAENVREFLKDNAGWPEPWTVMCIGSKDGPAAR